MIDAQNIAKGDAAFRATVLIVDDHAFLREGLRQLVNDQEDMAVVGEAADGNEALAIFPKIVPDVTLLDLQMAKMNGLAVLARIREIQPEAKVIGLTTHICDMDAARVLKTGATACLLKSGLHRHLIDTIRLSRAGITFLDPELAAGIVRKQYSADLDLPEVELLTRIANGTRYAQIASDMNFPQAAVEDLLRQTLKKLDSVSGGERINEALRRGITAFSRPY